MRSTLYSAFHYLLTWLLVWSGPDRVSVNGDYVLQVRTHSYDNPTNRCSDCIATNSDPAGCCDDFRVLGSCDGYLQCDNYFYYCLRTLGSAEAGCGGGQTTNTNTNGGSIDFTRPMVLGLRNPLPFDRKFSWNGDQLYLEVHDNDFDNSVDELVDRFLVNISTTTAPVGVETSRTVYNGIFGFATIELSFLVVCAENYYGPDCSRFCEQNCACDPGFTGEFCQTNIDDCVRASCPENNLCVDGINSFDCICNTGFTGAQCDVNINDCVGNPCSGNGQCMDGIDSFSCTCDPGFTGEFCDTNIDECLTMAINCSGNGDCVDEVNSYSCSCDPGFSGELCEININNCVGIACSGNGFCNDRVNTFACVCNTGFTGSLCETNINDCVGVNCSGNGQCEDGVDSFTCVCDPGFTGELCSIIVESQRGSGSNAGAIAGGSIGALVVLSLLVLVVIVIAVLVLKRQRTENFTNKTGPALPGDNPVYDTTADPNNIISLTVTPSSATAEYANINVSSTIGSTADHEFDNPIYGSPADSKPSLGSAPVYADPNEQDHEFDNPIYTTPGSDSLTTPAAAVVYASPDQGTYEYFSESVTNGHSGQ